MAQPPSQLIRTHELTEQNIGPLSGQSLDQIYCGLDCMVMLECLTEIHALSNKSPEIYDFERALQAPALEMMLRGFRVDQHERRKCIEDLKARVEFINGRLQRMAVAIWDKELNPRSPDQLKEFFYKHLRVPPIKKWQAGVEKFPMDRDALEKLSENWLAGPICDAILQIREDERSIKVLESEIDSDGRMRTSINIAATTTGRWSSSKNAEGTGGNLQNWKERLRRVMIADPGWKIGAIDLEQADAREIGFTLGVLFDDWKYLDNCESGDLHTNSSKLVWPELAWTGEAKADRKIAESIFYRDFSFRDMSKRGGHAVTYVGQPHTISRHLKIALKVAENFQQRFFGAYPGIPRLHLWTAQELQTTRSLRTYWGRERHFFGRANDDSTLREAVAHLGQSPTADRMSFGVYRLWDRLRHRIRFTTQLHDAVYFQYPEEIEDEIIPLALDCIQIPVRAPSGRLFVVPGEAKVGWNWSRKHDDGKPTDARTNPFNPNGLVKWRASSPDKRRREEGETL